MILAIDDDAGRYDGLRRYLGDRVALVVACCPTCVAGHLPAAAAVLLDYDLDSGEPCPGCLASFGMWDGYSKGIHHARAVRLKAPPTIVVSCSYPENVDRLVAAVRGIPKLARIAASETDPEIRWIGQLWAWGVL